MTTPRYVVGSASDATAALRKLARAGWHTREGFALPENAWDVTDQRLVLYGRVGDRDTAELAIHAAAAAPASSPSPTRPATSARHCSPTSPGSGR